MFPLSCRDKRRRQSAFSCAPTADGVSPSTKSYLLATEFVTLFILFPLALFERAASFVIGLNQAYRYLDANINLTVHPELIAEWQADYKVGERKPVWATKAKPPMEWLTDE